MTGSDSVRAAQKRDWGSFQQLAFEHQDLAYTLAFYLLGDADRAATALNLALRRASQEFHGFRSGSFRGWLMRRVLAACRENSGRFSLDPSRQGSIPARLLNLPADCRAVIILVDLLGLDYNEAAQATGFSPKAVSHRLARARREIAHGLSTTPPSPGHPI